MLVLEFHLPLSVQSLGIGGLLFALQTFVVWSVVVWLASRGGLLHRQQRISGCSFRWLVERSETQMSCTSGRAECRPSTK